MSPDVPNGVSIVLQQLKELETIASQTLQDLNTVAGAERITKWKAQTASLISNSVWTSTGCGIRRHPSRTIIHQRFGRRI